MTGSYIYVIYIERERDRQRERERERVTYAFGCIKMTEWVIEWDRQREIVTMRRALLRTLSLLLQVLCMTYLTELDLAHNHITSLPPQLKYFHNRSFTTVLLLRLLYCLLCMCIHIRRVCMCIHIGRVWRCWKLESDVHMYLCMYVFMYVCMYVCIYVCVCMYIIIYIHIWGLVGGEDSNLMYRYVKKFCLANTSSTWY